MKELILVIAVTLLACLSACQTVEQKADELVQTPASFPAPPVPAAASYPEKGWLPEYDEFIKNNVSEEMLNAPNSRMTKFCAEWPTLTKDQRRQFYADLFYSITKPESNYKRASMYWEEGQGTDSVTGLKIKTSEGFLQLSYSDKRGYGPACDFDYDGNDKPFHLKDIAVKPSSHGWLGLSPNQKNIQHPLKNLGCGIAIVDKLMRSEARKSEEFADLMGRYWATMRRSHASSYASIWKQMRERGSPCH